MLKIVAENLQPFDKKAKKCFELDEEALHTFLQEISKTGATYVDLNLGPLKKNKKEITHFFIDNIEKHSSLNILIDSTDPEITKFALERATRKIIINGFSLETKKVEEILPLASYYNVDIIGLVISTGFVPITLEEKVLIAEEMIATAEQKGVDRAQIILDPVIVPLGWERGAECAKANLNFIKHIPSIFGHEIRTIAGLSNLTTKAAGGSAKGILQGLYLSMLYEAGIDMIMLDVFNENTMKAVKFIKALEGRTIFSFAEFFS